MKRALSTQNVRTILRELGLKWSAARSLASSSICNHPSQQPKGIPVNRYGALSSVRHLTSSSSLSAAEIHCPFPDVEIPNVSFAEFMCRRCDEFKNRIAVSDFLTGRQYTYQQLKEYTIKVASALHKRGYRKGDIILSFAVNLPEFSFFVMAAASLGIIVSPANPAYTVGELKHMFRHSKPCAIFTIPQLMPLVKEALSDPDLQHNIKEIYIFGPAEDDSQSFSVLMEDDGKAFPENVDIDPAKDVLILPYSSGTTGLPKGVMLSHTNIVANILQFRGSTKIHAEDRILGLLPFFHIYGLAPVQFGSLHEGAELVTIPNFDPEAFLQVLEQKKISVLHIVPPIILFLAKHPLVSKFDLSSIRKMYSGAAPLGAGLTKECLNRLGAPIYQGYGLTETSPVINVDLEPGHPGTIGHLVSNTKAKLVDVETGKPVEVGEMGEYCMDGPQKMLGYWNDQEATDKMIDKDGWLHTGDLGYMREDGMVVIADRLKELIKYKGFQVPPAELEGLMLTHPAVQDVGVIGVPDEEAGELPRAYVVLKPNQTASAEDIASFVEENVSPQKKLRGGVEFVEEIPKTASGKILRRVLKEKVL